MIDTILKIVAATLLGFCLFFFGGLATSMDLPPAQLIKRPIAVTEVLLSSFQIETCNKNIRWGEPLPETTGVSINTNPLDTRYTLYTSTHDTTARLIDSNGRVAHSWSFQYHDVFQDTSHIIALKNHVKNQHFYLRDFHLYDNGDIILMIAAAGVTPWGMGFVKLDKDSNVLWSYTGYVNNDFDVDDNGLIYTIEHKQRSDQPDNVQNVFLPFLEDNIATLDAHGKNIGNISIVDALSNSKYSALLNRFEDDGHGDPSHSNSITHIKQTHPTIPWIQKGHLIISVRNLNSFVVLDPATSQITYASDLPSRWQHDIDLLKNGNLLMFDNRGDLQGSDYTRVVELNPVTHKIIWARDKDAFGNELHSDFFGEQQRYENGNTFIVYAEKSQLFEVSPKDEVIWAYTSPLHRNVDGEDRLAIITSAERIQSNDINFIERYCSTPQ